ncbi:hybrid sensor histidine kinase/response regulator [Acidisphaera sp. S103]|uniref:sensor histidine kinase n=1 Tax=Acidisphaera sp. S103 TaxID=1747223 RepID=UPI00131E4977|nr:hybrid sensor histidine kinase/response regulator [Acidisphaera sp. S103]
MDSAPEITDSRRVRFFKGTATEQAHRVTRQIVGTAAALALCMWIFIAWSWRSEYRVSQTVGRVQEFNLIAAFANELTLTLDAASGALQLVQNEMGAMPPSATPEDVRARLQQAIRGVTGPMRDIRVIAPDGRLLFSTRHPDPGPEDVSGHANFVHLRDDLKAGLVINAFGPASGPDRTITVRRRLETVDQAFAGEAILMMKPGSLIGLRHEVDLGRRGTIVVAGADGVILAGFDRDHPDGSMGVGTNLLGAPYPDNLRPGETGSYMRYSRVDGVQRLIAVRRLATYPLNILVGLDMSDVTAEARDHAILIGTVGGGTTILIAVLTLLLVREVWRRTRREIEMTADRERLQLAQQQIEVERSRLAETNRELVDSKERAEIANRTKSQFLAHMSHELRTPLHAIIGFSELIRDQAPTKPGSPPIAGYASDILTSGRHLLDLINTILDITKIESGTATLTERLFPFADLARNALVSVRAQAEMHRITLDLRLPEIPLRLFADRTRLLQVLINLLANAVKFTPDDGEIVLSVAFNAADDVILSVIDSGIGMTEAEILVALEPFGQVDNTLSRTFEGTGLGLPLASRLMELHGGRLDLTSIKGRGTAARVTLPAWRVARPGAGAA